MSRTPTDGRYYIIACHCSGLGNTWAVYCLEVDGQPKDRGFYNELCRSCHRGEVALSCDSQCSLSDTNAKTSQLPVVCACKDNYCNIWMQMTIIAYMLKDRFKVWGQRYFGSIAEHLGIFVPVINSNLLTSSGLKVRCAH